MTRRGVSAMLAMLPCAALLGGCSDATGSVRGGELLFVDPQLNSACSPDAGNGWSALYGCYFGLNGKASCSALTECHNAASDPGSVLGFVCGTTKDSCYRGFTANFPPGNDAGAIANAQAVVYYLRGPGVEGPTMPCNLEMIDGVATCSSQPGGQYAFTSDDIARINAWISEGAQEN